MNICNIIEQRLKEFEELGNKGFTTFEFFPFLNLKINATIQTELAFCISTANSSALSGLRFQKSLENLNLESLSVKDFENLLKSAGVRFWSRKAEYIYEALRRFEVIEKALKLESRLAREYLVRNIRGIGYKEASHFLRNVGRKDVAIIDRHILRWLHENDYLREIPKSLSTKSYKKIENTLEKIAKKRRISLAELDLILWFQKTGKILK